ncbi:MAG: SLBB domain-containing protein, partial [Caulobacterales bacterium]|nr:SLBB domain-containing protein [Caulobacterales bacterium]
VEVWLQTDGVFYVLGEVNAPGAFAYRPGISLNDAIASAGGASARAEPGWADHESEGADGPIRRSLAGEPVTVAPGDVVRVRAAEG